MGKNKKTRNKVVKKKLQQVATAKKALNPFEIRINKQKHDILGRKTKNDRGMPGISRNKAIKKRKETLLQEYKSKSKSNSYVDRRFGEHDSEINPEDRAALRFAIERKKSKSNMFNLNEDEELTHLGRSIGQMDKFDDPLSESEDEERVDGDIVKKAHFGGFLTKKNSEESEKSHKAIMDEIIADRIKRKQERQRERENNMDLTDKLDGDWKDIQKLMIGLKNSNETNDGGEQKKKDDYDIKVQELKFEAKGKATDKLKSPEDLAFEERQKLENLEMERKQRMNAGGINQSYNKSYNHVSADGLDDNFEIEPDEEEENEISSFPPSQRLKEPVVEEASEDEKNDSEESEENDEDNGEQGDSSGEESDDSYADVLSDEEIDETEKLQNTLFGQKLDTSKNNKSASEKLNSIPFVIDCPTSFEEFFDLIANRSVDEISTIIERIIKCTHPSLGSDNKEKMENLFAILLQYIDEISSSSEMDSSILNPLTIHCHSLLQMSPGAMSNLLLDVIVEKREEFRATCKGKKKPIVQLSTLIYLKLVSILFPTSDFLHPVVTPSTVFMSEMLTNQKISSLIDVEYGLFLCSLFYEYVSVSKRLVPEAINFLNSMLKTFISHSAPEKIGFLTVDSEFFQQNAVTKLSVKLLRDIESEKTLNQNELVCNTLNVALKLCEQFALLYAETPSFSELFCKIELTISTLPIKSFPKILSDRVNDLVMCLSKSVKKSYLRRENRRPPTLKFLEPKIQDRFDGKKQHHGSKKKLEQQKLLHKYKREMKGAMREIRRDNQFIASEKLNEQLDQDADRKAKLKRLYQDLASQEGDFKKYKKKK